MALVLPKFSRRRLSAERRVAKRAEPALGLKLLNLQDGLEPHELLEFEYCVRRIAPDLAERLEVSVVWRTEGKGTEDFGVHYFESVAGDQLREAIDRQANLVCTTLPAAPFSYEGQLMSIKWCIRLRLFMVDSRDISTEQAFYLGNLTVEV